jgi:hypothetical protein
MAIEPSGVIQQLKKIVSAADIEPCLAGIYIQLPTCINRAIGTLQCTQLELEYKGIVARMQTEFEFDLHQAFKDQVAKILARPR